MGVIGIKSTGHHHDIIIREYNKWNVMGSKKCFGSWTPVLFLKRDDSAIWSVCVCVWNERTSCSPVDRLGPWQCSPQTQLEGFQCSGVYSKNTGEKFLKDQKNILIRTFCGIKRFH